MNEDFKKVECPNLEHKKRGFLGGVVCQNETVSRLNERNDY